MKTDVITPLKHEGKVRLWVFLKSRLEADNTFYAIIFRWLRKKWVWFVANEKGKVRDVSIKIVFECLWFVLMITEKQRGFT